MRCCVHLPKARPAHRPVNPTTARLQVHEVDLAGCRTGRQSEVSGTAGVAGVRAPDRRRMNATDRAHPGGADHPVAPRLHGVDTVAESRAGQPVEKDPLPYGKGLGVRVRNRHPQDACDPPPRLHSVPAATGSFDLSSHRGITRRTSGTLVTQSKTTFPPAFMRGISKARAELTPAIASSNSSTIAP
jgi:hypothetical protein